MKYALLGQRVVSQRVFQTDSGTWNSEAIKTRKFGTFGIVVGFHDSHGVFFDVLHDETGVVAPYDPFELALLEQGDGRFFKPNFSCPNVKCLTGGPTKWDAVFREVEESVEDGVKVVYFGWACRNCGCVVHRPYMPVES